MTDKHKNNEDEEIAIDFSKVKNWFKKDKKSHSKTESASHRNHEHHNKHDPDKNTHTDHADTHGHHESHKHETHEAKKKDDESWDYKETLDFFKKHGTWFLILIPIILTIFLRLQPMYLPMTDDWAENSVYGYYQNQVAQQINAQYPNLPDANKQALINSEFQKFLSQNGDMVEQQIAQASQQYKERLMYESGDSKYVYLGDIDSYYWLRDARKFLQNGTMCDEIDYEKELCYIDTYTSAPTKSSISLKESGIGQNKKLYAYVIFATNKVLSIFSPDITLMQSSFYVPLIFGIISAILSFLIGKMIGGSIAGLVTSIFISINPIHLSRTLGSDNDPLNIFFPLLIVFLLLHTFKSDSTKNKLVFGALTGLAISFFAASWQGWWFMFNFILGTLIIYAGFIATKEILTHRSLKNIFKQNKIKDALIVTTTIFFSTAIFTIFISGLDTFTDFLLGPLWFTQTKEAALGTFWPNVLVTVAEFNPASISTIISQMGGKLIFFLGLLGILFIVSGDKKISKQHKYVLAIGALIYLFLSSAYGTTLGPKTYMFLIALPVILGMITLLKTKQDVDLKLAILLVIWFVATTYAALKGVRFTLLMVSAFGVAFGITVSSIYRIVSRWISSELKINEILTKTVVAVLLLLLLIAPVKAGYNTATNFLPSVNDAWYNSLTKIKENSEPEAIINSWWDFGHWFKYLADRRVTLDGSSQTGPPLHWLGKLMVTNNEKRSVGILRMLDCGSNKAFNELNKILNNTPQSIDVLDKVVTLKKRDAGSELLEIGLTKDQASSILNHTHCEPPENFFITSEDMVGKAGVWGHFGSWDFQRAEMFNKVKGTDSATGKEILSDPRYNLTEEQIDQYYYEIQTQSDSEWITPWPGYLSAVQNCQTPGPTGFMVCPMTISGGQQIPLGINLTNMDVLINAQGNPKPTSIVYVTENGTEEKKFEGNVLGFSIVLIPRGAEGYAVLGVHPQLANSMFTRLFYLEGHGLKYFDKFSDQNGITGGRIIVWKVDWEGNSTNEVFKAVTEEELQQIDELESALQDSETILETNDESVTKIERGEVPENSPEDGKMDRADETSEESTEDGTLDAEDVEIEFSTE